MSHRPTLRVDIQVELICPWCQIGKRHFERARALLCIERPDVDIETHWHLQPLLPDLPEQGRPFAEFYRERLGSEAAVAARQAQVQAAARLAGLHIAFEAIERMPHTGLAHALLRDAREQLPPQAFERLLDALFAAHFQHGQSLSDLQLLACMADTFGIASSAKMPPPEPAGPGPGVPFFVFDGRLALSGAQPVGALLAAMRQALAR